MKKLQYRAPDFGPLARKCVTGGEPFQAVLVGADADAARVYVDAAGLSPSFLGGGLSAMPPALGLMMGLVAIAIDRGRSVTARVEGDDVLFVFP